MINLTLVVVLGFTMQQFQTVYAALGAFAGSLAALAIYHLFWVRPALARDRRLLEVHDGLIAGAGGNAAERFAALDGIGARVSALEALAATDISRYGFVRYDAFTDSGDGLSYALALLNRQGDGVVINSIYSRTDTRTYGKAVERFKPAAHASGEELEAIERARLATS